MKEYFVIMRSSAAPIISDTSEYFIKANTPKEAFEKCNEKYNHPCKLFSAGVFEDANAYHKQEPALYTWLSKKAGKQEGW